MFGEEYETKSPHFLDAAQWLKCQEKWAEPQI